MVELLFVTCMAMSPSSPETCREHSLVFTDVSPMTCMMGAQPQLAKWALDHPGQRILRWSCRAVDLSRREA